MLDTSNEDTASVDDIARDGRALSKISCLSLAGATE